MTGLHGLGTPGKLIQTPATRSAEAGKKKKVQRTVGKCDDLSVGLISDGATLRDYIPISKYISSTS